MFTRFIEAEAINPIHVSDRPTLQERTPPTPKPQAYYIHEIKVTSSHVP